MNYKTNYHNPDLSLILPCYNESAHIDESLEKIVSELGNSRFTYEIILIDDKSTDRTSEHLKKFVKKYPNLKVFFHKKNAGRGGTVSEGISMAKGKVVGFIDVDLEVSPVYIPTFVSAILNGSTDVAIAKRYYPFRPFPPKYIIREIITPGYIYLAKLFLNLPVSDTEAGYKFFNRERILNVVQKTKHKHWFWDTEIVMRSFLEGLKVIEIPVLRLRKTNKQSTVRVIPDSIAHFKALISLKKIIRSENNNPPGLLYRFPLLYTFAMKTLFGKYYENRYTTIENLITPGSSVVDVCCGDLMLYNYIKQKVSNYIGLDISLDFIFSGISKNIQVKLSDVSNDPIPQADYIILQGSLYQFNNKEALVKKLFSSAKKALIISESIHNLKDSPLGSIIKRLGVMLVKTNTDNHYFRFNDTLLKKQLKNYNPKFIYIKGKKDIIAYIEKKGN